MMVPIVDGQTSNVGMALPPARERDGMARDKTRSPRGSRTARARSRRRSAGSSRACRTSRTWRVASRIGASVTPRDVLGICLSLGRAAKVATLLEEHTGRSRRSGRAVERESFRRLRRCESVSSRRLSRNHPRPPSRGWDLQRRRIDAELDEAHRPGRNAGC